MKCTSYFLVFVLFALVIPATPVMPQAQPVLATAADGWISHATADEQARPIVLKFRRTFNLAKVPTRFPVQVTADNRFVLYVNGKRVVAGPSVGDEKHWRFSSVDLARHLQPGTNVVAAVVWNGVRLPSVIPANATADERVRITGFDTYTQTAPLFQRSVATGFRLIGLGQADVISTSAQGWRVAVDEGHSLTNGLQQGPPGYYVAGAPEKIDSAKSVWDWLADEERSGKWHDAVPAPAAARRILVSDLLPPQSYTLVDSGRVVRSNLDEANAFPERATAIPAGRQVKLLIQRDSMISAYPVLRVTGGKGAIIKLHYGEALYDGKGKKGDRNLIADRQVKGVYDTFVLDGNAREFAPLWWRTWRYLEVEITVAAEPVHLESLQTFETGYPFAQIGAFKSNDPELNRIWDIGWRTARVDAHETYMDSSYWEQLQYVGDTRLQMLISYAVSGDPRLAEQAIDAFANSNADGGLTEGAYPSRGSNVIAPFSLLWIGMLADWRMEQPDRRVITRNLPRIREVLTWFKPWLSPRGLLTKNPQWNFVDWVGQNAGDRDVFPSYSRKESESCLTSIIYLGALRQAANIEREFGNSAIAGQDAVAAAQLKQAIREHCWSAERKLFANNPDKQDFSQHMNALAVLYDVVPRAEGRALLDRIVAPQKGIDAPEGMATTSYYFAWYLIRAFEHVGNSDRYHDLLKTWRDLLVLNYTTWPEERGDTRSDTHAWSAHPTADLLGIVAGIRPAAAGYARVIVRPSLGGLTSLDAVAATPRGPVKVQYRVSAGTLTAEIDIPAKLPGTFVWGEQSFRLKRGRNLIVIPLSKNFANSAQ